MMVIGTSSTYVLWSKKKNIFVQDWTFLRNRCTKFANLAIFSSITKIVKSLPNWTKNICRSIFATPLEMLNSKFFWVGSLPNSAQGIFDITKKIFAALYLPLHLMSSLLLLLLLLNTLKKIPKFDNFSNRSIRGHFTIRYLLERQK